MKTCITSTFYHVLSGQIGNGSCRCCGGDCWSSRGGVGLVGSSASVLRQLVGVLGALQCIALALAVPWLITESAGGRGVAGATRAGCR